VNRQLGTIAVDLTLILPGGENGGAKIFMLDLLSRLACMAPKTEFILLTHAASHAELAPMDRPNMRRQLVAGQAAAQTSRTRAIFGALHSKIRGLHRHGGSGQLLHDLGVDLLFCPFTAPTYFEFGIPMVCTIYDLQHKTYPGFFEAAELVHRDQLFAAACRHASALAAISDYARDSAIAHGRLDPTRIATIYLRMAQRVSANAEGSAGAMARHGLVAQQYLLYPANFWKHKNHEMLLTAFGMACRSGLAANIKLVCTGAPGVRQAWLVRAAQAMGLAERVLLPGHLPMVEFAELMANCRGVVFPSLYEGFGLPVIEAMAAGVPVACSNTTALPEVAGEASLLFDPRVPTQIAQAMIALVDDAALRAKLVQAGRHRALCFSDSNRMASEYWQLFERAVENSSNENTVAGVYADGWIGDCLRVQVASCSEDRTLKIELFTPQWLPVPRVSVQASRRGKKHGAPLMLERGAGAVFLLKLDATDACYKIKISPTFVPARAMGGEDRRVLSAVLQKCSIEHANGECIELFPVNRTTL
jgi:glycosyltransferase involved in cell wall biosynthesis